MKDRVESWSVFAAARNAAVASLLAGALPLGGAALAQEQQAGNEASTNVEETFQALIEQCDDVDALMLRARIRLQLGRTTDEAREEAQALLDQGLAACGEGNLDDAKATLQNALDIASAGSSEVFAAQEATADAADGMPTGVIAAGAALVALLGWFFFRRRSA